MYFLLNYISEVNTVLFSSHIRACWSHVCLRLSLKVIWPHIVLPVSPVHPGFPLLPGSAAPGQTTCCWEAPRTERNVPENQWQARLMPRLLLCCFRSLHFLRPLCTRRHKKHGVQSESIQTLLLCWIATIVPNTLVTVFLCLQNWNWPEDWAGSTQVRLHAGSSASSLSLWPSFFSSSALSSVLSEVESSPGEAVTPGFMLCGFFITMGLGVCVERTGTVGCWLTRLARTFLKPTATSNICRPSAAATMRPTLCLPRGSLPV